MSAFAPIRITPIVEGRAPLCRRVLADLPDWFGIATAVDAYSRRADDLPMFAAFDGSESVGFVSIKAQTAFAAEIHALGVLRSHHRRGVGRALIDAAHSFAGSGGFRFPTVKTVAPSRPDPNYAATRLFYEDVGFVPIEVFPTLWGSANPCLMLLRTVETITPRGC